MSTTQRRHEVRVFPAGAAERQGARAGVASRTVVMVIDAAYAAGLVAVGYAVWAGVRLLRGPRRFAWPEIGLEVIVTVALLVAVSILASAWSSTGRSPGARLMGLRVIGPGGTPPGFVRSLLRALTCVMFPIGLFWSAFSARNASLQDLVFSTIVVYDWHERTPAPAG
ncbi:MAG: RDD family protein [Actinomycetota bacterium]|nr:RDD family protein [Actinomycetota bacterium]MDH5224448.1 RDD family protein [Actinomycetota bacterium]MDH5314712.1 RDD family protein [Actinomycetota bacterium]